MFTREALYAKAMACKERQEQEEQKNIDIGLAHIYHRMEAAADQGAMSIVVSYGHSDGDDDAGFRPYTLSIGNMTQVADRLRAAGFTVGGVSGIGIEVSWTARNK